MDQLNFVTTMTSTGTDDFCQEVLDDIIYCRPAFIIGVRISCLIGVLKRFNNVLDNFSLDLVLYFGDAGLNDVGNSPSFHDINSSQHDGDGVSGS